MATNPTYPGVYIEEVPSPVRSIAAVATSRTAFIGRARRGPTNEPVSIKNYGDYERRFGGLWRGSTMSYAVRQYFQNGGTDAIIIRVDNGGARATAALPTAALSVPVEARTAGARGNSIRIAVTPSQDRAFAGDPRYFDVHESGEKTNGDRDEKTHPNQTLATLAQKLDADGVFVQVKSGATLPANATHILYGKHALSGGTDLATAHALLVDTDQEVVLKLAAKDPGAAGNSIQVRVLNASGANPPPEEFDLRIKKGGNNAVDLKNQTLATIKQALIAGDHEVRVADGFTVPGTGRPANTPSLANLTGGSDETAATLPAPTDVFTASFQLEAANPGAWGDRLFATIDHDVRGGEGAANRFNLLVEEVGADGTVVRFEHHRNVSVDGNDERRLDAVLQEGSDMVRFPTGAPLPSTPPLPAADLPFINGGDGNILDDNDLRGNEGRKEGLYALEKEDLFNILCIPPPDWGNDVDADVWSEAIAYCTRRRAMLLVDPPLQWTDKDRAVKGIREGPLSNLRHPNAALYFPRLRIPDPRQDGRIAEFVPCGAVAGLYARTDSARGVWKAPAGQAANIVGVQGLTVRLTDLEHGDLNPLGVNCARTFPVTGTVMWGARTLRGADQLASEWKYVSVRRTALYIEESLYRGTQWVVFEPNDEPLWAQIRLNVGAFMHNLFRSGAFQGKSSRDAYFVKCDAETNPPEDVDRGIVNILVGFAPLKPAEFVIIRISQITKQGGA